ncbi:MAG: M14 family metallocarboxypeptidase [Luteolibacter sp.]
MQEVFDWPGFLPSFSAEAAARGFSSSELCKTSSGSLIAWERPAKNRPVVYLSSGIHGDEPSGPLALLELMRADLFTDEIHWLICPALNPEGLSAATRENASRVDLNRGYWSLTSPETVAHVSWLKQKPTPRLFISLHEDWETSGFYFYEINLLPDDPERSLAILESVAPWFPPEPNAIIDGHDIRGPGWIYHAAEPDLPEGWPEAIYLAKNGCPLSYTFETPSQAPLARRVAAHMAAVKAACKNSLIF